MTPGNQPFIEKRVMPRRWCHALLILLLLLHAGPTPAQSSEDKAAAMKLFRDGKKLMAAGSYREASRKFEASLELVPNLGTRLNLGVCYEKLGKVASAWSQYREAEMMAEDSDNTALAKRADKLATALEPDLPRLVIRVADPTLPDLVITRDGKVVSSSLFGESIYVDPGPHRIRARADGHRPFATTVEADRGDEVMVEIPVLEAKAADSRVTKPGATRSKRRIFGFVSMAAGGVAVASSLAFGWSAAAQSDRAFADGLCDPELLKCSIEGQALNDSAHRRARAADVLVGTGVVLVGAGVYLYLTAPKRREGASALVPVAGRDRLGVAFLGRF